MARKGQGHIKPAPVVSTAAPLFCAGALRLRRIGVVEEKPRIAFERGKVRIVGEDETGSDERAAPVLGAFDAARVEKDQVPPRNGLRMITIGRVEIRELIRRLLERPILDPAV